MNMHSNSTSLKFIALSGTTAVTENFYVYEYGNDMIVVDCGVGFPEPEMFGVDLVIPDFTYIKENASKIRGVLISHGHEDHLGALPFLLKEVNLPIYATKLVAGFIEDKFLDYEMKVPKVNVFDPEKDVLSLGSFRVTPFRVSHSVPDGVGFAIDTPEGKIFHVPDYKFDWTPVDGKPFDVKRMVSLASEGVLGLASDALGATTPGYTESEREIESRLEEIIRKGRGRTFFTTISSNISRMQQLLNICVRLGKKVQFVGRSIEKKAEIAKDLGYLTYPNDVIVSSKDAVHLNKNLIVYIISGSYGQPGSALYRLATGEHKFLKVESADLVIFSSDPAPPGSKTNTDFIVDKLIDQDVEVHYYDTQEDLHVSGHGSQKDILLLFGLLRPKYFIPIGGTKRHMRAYNLMAQSMGAIPGDVFELGSGDVVEFKNGNARVTGKVPTRNILVDGLGIGDVGNVVLRDRHVLAKDGVAIIMLPFDGTTKKLYDLPEIISRGFVFEEKEKAFLKQTAVELKKHLEIGKTFDSKFVKDRAVNFLEKYFFEKTGRRPMVVPVIVEI
jgi:ribonuclease J